MHASGTGPKSTRGGTILPGVLLAAAVVAFGACGPGAEGERAEDEASTSRADAAPADRRAGDAPAARLSPGDPVPADERPETSPKAVEPEPGEDHLANLRMLTFEGQNAEAYFSPDGRRFIMQATRPGESRCDQIYTMDLDGRNLRLVSTGRGRTTCGYFFPSGERILYSSTHHAGPECPPPPDRSRGYVWALYDYDIYAADPDGSNLERIFRSPGYDAEGTTSPDGDRIVFTSTRDGDLDIYTMNPDGSDVRRLTHEEGYDGGAFYSPDGSRIVYRAHHPEDPEALRTYRSLLEDGLVKPTRMEIYVMDADGSNKRQLTDNGAANFAPFFHPSGEKIIFSSNMDDPEGWNFDLYMIGIDGTGLERITTHPTFDSFPMFSRDGTTLVFASNRNARNPHDTNVFVADWVEEPGGE